jgi:hypothetical protein
MWGAQWSSLNDFRGAKVICVTHGHYDHYIDTPSILRETDATVVASKDICKHLNSTYKINEKRLLAVEPLQQVDICGFKITAFEWGHREVTILRLAKEGLLRAELLSTLQFAWLNLLKVPFYAPYFGFHVEGPNNLRLMNYCEGFSDAMKINEILKMGQRFKTDILLAGMQLNFEEELSKGVAALAPKTVVLFHPHTAMFERLGLKSSPPQVFVDKISQALPDANVIVAEPQMSLTFPSPS